MERAISERSKAEMRQTAETITTSRKLKKITPVNKTSYSRILAKFRVNMVKKSVGVNMIARKVGEKRTPEAPVTSDKKSFTAGLHNILDADLLEELTTEDSQLRQLRKHILAKDREGFL